MEASVDGEPVQLSALVLIIDIALNTSQVAKFALFDVYQKLHIIPNDMVLLLVLLKTIFLSIENVALNAANKADLVFVLLELLLFLSNLCKFVNNDGSDNLIHDNLDDEEVAKIDQNIPDCDS